MNFYDYQAEAVKTAIYPKRAKIYYPALGLAGEAGEVANKVKKILRDDRGQLSETKREELFDEIGDALWYIAALCTDLGLSMDDVAKENIKKLKDRQERNTLKGDGDKR